MINAVAPAVPGCTLAGRRPARRRSAFTLVQMLVAIGIIIVLAGVLLPAVNYARRQAQRNAMRADLAAIGTALEAYRQDFGDYPRIYNDPVTGQPGWSGAIVLCRALIGPTDEAGPAHDGADGPGFRIRAGQGRPYGPYLASTQFKVREPGNLNRPVSTDTIAQQVILDRLDHPILYYPASPAKPNVRSAAGLLAAAKTSLYDIRDNSGVVSRTPGDQNILAFLRRPGDDPTDGFKRLATMLGDYDPDNPLVATNFDGSIDGGESPVTTGPYLLWSAGMDGVFGADLLTPARIELQKCDDITNFRD